MARLLNSTCPMDDHFAQQRWVMVETQLAARGIQDPRVLDAMARVPRERFVPPLLVHLAYANGPQSIGNGQTISQPYIVALMAQALRLTGTEHVLEVGCGSGYGAAVLAQLCARVVSVERDAVLCSRARALLMSLGVHNVRVVLGDVTLGVADEAPFSGICVTAVGPEIPASLVAQLAPGGRLVMPVGTLHDQQRLWLMTRDGGETLNAEDLGPVRFVPLIGAEAFAEEAPAPTDP